MRTTHKFAILLPLLLVCCVLGVDAKVRLPRLVSDGMVLQRDVAIKVWGFADANEKVRVVFLGSDYLTHADAAGRWAVTLPALKAGGPFEMQINDLTLRDVLVGDVWLCSGQSNMELPVARVMDRYAEEVRSYENPQIRHIKIPTDYTFHGESDVLPYCAWRPLTQEHVADFSALAYFFARRLHETTGVPVGVVNASVGGSPVEAWMSEEALRPFPAITNSLGMLRSDDFIRSTEQLDNLRRTLWHAQLNAADAGCGAWHAAELNDADWARYDLFDCSWTRDVQGRLINGSVWLRRAFDASTLDPSRSATLRMGCLVDADSVFVNGHFVGTTSYQYPPRIYTIPAGVLRAEGNVVAVRLISYGGEAGVVEDKPYKIIQDAQEVSLRGEWRFRRGAVMPPLAGEAFFRWRPTALFNGMLAPLFGYGFKGVIWYQGESNTGDVARYGELLPRMIAEWRARFEAPELPFLLVQLPGFMRTKTTPTESGWAQMREVQRRTAEEVPHAALAVTLDAGEWNDIHPLDKRTIADRLVLAARKLIYGEPIAASGPEVERAVADRAGVVIHFNATGGAPVVDKTLRGFAVAGADRRFVWAEARSDGECVVVSCDKVANPRYVRYAWADNPEGANLRNAAGIPASPFEVAVADKGTNNKQNR